MQLGIKVIQSHSMPRHRQLSQHALHKKGIWRLSHEQNCFVQPDDIFEERQLMCCRACWHHVVNFSHNIIIIHFSTALFDQYEANVLCGFMNAEMTACWDSFKCAFADTNTHIIMHRAMESGWRPDHLLCIQTAVLRES